MTILLEALKVKVPMPFAPEAWAVSNPAYGAAPDALVPAINLPTVAELLIPPGNGFETFEYPAPLPFSKEASVHVEPNCPVSKDIGAFCEYPTVEISKMNKVFFFIILSFWSFSNL